MSYFGLVLRNLLRNRLRAVFTVGSVAMATALTCLMLTMPAGFDRLISALSSESRVAVHAKAGFVFTLPPAYLEKVRTLEGVEAASSSTWFGGIHDEKAGVEFASFAVDPQAAKDVFADYPIDEQAFASFVHERQGALVGRATMKSKGWHLGDRVSLTSPGYGVTLDLRIVGVIDSPQMGEVWFQRAYLEESLRAEGRSFPGIGTLWVRVANQAKVPSVIQTIDAKFAAGEVHTATETERDFNADLYGGMEGILGIIALVTTIVSLSIVFIGASTASVTVRERAGEIAVLRALGFSRRTLFGLLIAETTVLASFAGALGVLLAILLTALMRGAAERAGGMLSMLQAFVVGPGVVAQGFAIAVLIGVLAGLVPAASAVRRGITVTLKEVF